MRSPVRDRLYATVVLSLTALPALAQLAPAPDGALPAQQEQASLPAAGGFSQMVTAMRNSGDVGARIDALGPLPDSKVEWRDAYALEQYGGNRDQLQAAFSENRDGIQRLRQDIIKNRSIDRALSRDQIPLDHVLAANVEQDGRVIVYAYPQTYEPPR